MPRRKIEWTAGKNHFLPDIQTEKNAPGSSLPIICEQIRCHREKIGMEQKALAQALSISANTVSNWENGRSRPDINLLPAVCRILNINLYDLFGISNPDRTDPEEQRLLTAYRQLSPAHRYAVRQMTDTLLHIEQEQSYPDLTPLLYINKALAAGIGDPAELENDAETVYVYTTPSAAKADWIFSINGDSMEPDFHNGEEVLVQRITQPTDLRYGEIGAFIVGNETYIKQYEPDGLHSLNPDYPVMHFEDEDAVYLIGRVIDTLPPDSYASQTDIDLYRHFIEKEGNGDETHIRKSLRKSQYRF